MSEGAAGIAERVAALKIAYVPLTHDLSGSGDRRRFVHWATTRSVPFEIARPSVDYDLVVLSQAADLSSWRRLQAGRTRLIYDLTDAYLKIPATDVKSLARGTAKFLTRQTRRLEPSFRHAIEGMCRRADAVVCCSPEQRADVLSFCQNVHVILDVHDAVLGTPKSTYDAGSPFRLVWEGLPENVGMFRVIASVLEDIALRHDISLEVVTRPTHYRWMGQFGMRDTGRLLERTVPIPTVVHPWDETRLAAICTAADLAVIPVPLDDALAAGKPENKLILLWRMGLPVITSATPAYRRTMTDAGLEMACDSPEEWGLMLERCLTDESFRRAAATSGRAFAESQHSEERTLARWDEAVMSVLS